MARWSRPPRAGGGSSRVLHGLKSMTERAEEARKLVTWGTRGFERVDAFEPGEIVADVEVYGGNGAERRRWSAGRGRALHSQGRQALSVGPGHLPCARSARRSPRATKLAELKIMCDGQLIQSAPLYAADSVEEGDIVRKATDALKELALGWLLDGTSRVDMHEPGTPAKARFVTFEGGEGVGKSTQVKRLLANLSRVGIAAVRTREPGGTPKAEAIRSFILQGRSEALGRRAPRRCCSPPPASTTSTS